MQCSRDTLAVQQGHQGRAGGDAARAHHMPTYFTCDTGNRQQACQAGGWPASHGVCSNVLTGVVGGIGVGRLAELGYGDGDEVRVVGVWQHESAFPLYEVCPHTPSSSLRGAPTLWPVALQDPIRLPAARGVLCTLWSVLSSLWLLVCGQVYSQWHSLCS